MYKLPALRSVGTRIVASCLAALLILSAAVADAAANPKQVLVLNSFGRQFRPWSEYAKSIRSELAELAPWPLDITSYSIVSARSGSEDPEIPFIEYLKAYYGDKPPDLVVAMGAPAAIFVQRHRERLFAATPVLFTAVDQRFVKQSALTTNDTAVAVDIEIRPLFDNILKVLPDTKLIAVISGDSPSERFWVAQLQKDLKPLESKTQIAFWNDLSFDEMLKRAAALPKHSALFWPQLRVDAAGVVHEGNRSLEQLSAVTNAPIFSYDDTFFTGDTVGGPMLSMSEVSRSAATVAIRLLSGERPAAIETPPIGFAPPRYDWRQLRRWNISESNLPENSEVLFKEPSLLEKYPTEIALVTAALIVQAALISGLLYERRRRRIAEADSRQRFTELAHINRRATAGELSSSLAHELSQPLAAILTNAETAELLLKTNCPDLKEINQILVDIRRDDHRASEVLLRLRQLLRKQPLKPTSLDLHETVRQVLEITAPMARQHGIDIREDFSSVPIYVQGDAVQLQQVLLNLIVNAIDAMPRDRETVREIVVRSYFLRDSAEISVADTGHGIASELMDKVFDPFFSTKPEGMGIGLSIARTIVIAHGGRIWLEQSPRGGADFHIRLPAG